MIFKPSRPLIEPSGAVAAVSGPVGHPEASQPFPEALVTRRQVSKEPRYAIN